MRATMHVKSHPMHPMLVFFPLGLWITSLFFDFLGWQMSDASLVAAGFYCVIGGCVGAALAAIPGVIDLFTVVPPSSSGQRRGFLHGSINVLALILFAFIAWRRGAADNPIDGLSVGLSLLGVIGIIISGWLGATLVYRNQIGIDHRYAGAGKWKERTIDNWSRPLLNQDELGPGQMMLGHIQGERVVAAKCGHGVATFGDRCTHKGGPLSDGALVGCTVQCPWHGSQFDVHSGRVVAGPAEKQIDTFDHETRAGEVYITKPGGAPKKKDEEKAA